jgi:phage/plasmid-like protein (TIGR03299 family)
LTKMAHELTTRANGQTEMAFVGETPWHGLGQRVTQGATIEVWAREAGLDWTAKRSAVQYPFGDTMREFGDKHVIYRSDTGAPLATVSKDYKLVQPLEVLEFFRDLTEAGDWHIHTAGTMQGGRRLWALASNHTEGLVAPGDRVRGNLLLATSLDGTMRTMAAMTSIRVVCANTMRTAFADVGASSTGKVAKGTKGAISVSHRSEFDAASVKEHLGVARQSFDQFMNQAREMANSGISKADAVGVLRELFGQPKPVVSSVAPAPAPQMSDASILDMVLSQPVGEQREHRNIPKVMSLFEGAGRGADHPGAAGTKWGLFNAVTEFIDHSASRTQDTRLTSAWFGQGHELKVKALELLTVGAR